MKVRLDKRALADLDAISDWVGAHAGKIVAGHYIDRIEARCLKLVDAPRGGRIRRKSRPILYSVPFERTAVVLYRLAEHDVVVLRILRGQNVGAAIRGLR